MKKALVLIVIISLFALNPYSSCCKAGISAPNLKMEEIPEGREENAIIPIETKMEIDTIVLSFVGDCTIGDDETYTWNTFDEVYNTVKNPGYFFDGVKSVLSSDDFTFVNLEGTFTNAKKKAIKEYCFKGKPEYCDILLKGSIEGVTLANNHTMDYFQKGFDDTVKALNQVGIAYTYFDTYLVKEIKGVKIGFLGYKGWSSEKRSNDLLIKHVREMKSEGVAFIVANYHWGDQKVDRPNALQRRMARFAIDNGVDLVVGHHPHVLQGKESYKEKSILYSLGNFCYGGSPNPRDKDTIIYQQVIGIDVEKNTIIEVEEKIIPARISSDSKRNNYQPVLAVGDEKERIAKKFEKLCDALKTYKIDK